MLSPATLGDYLSVVKSLRVKVWLKITNTSYFLVACNVLGVFQIENVDFNSVPLGEPTQRLWPSSPNQWTVLTVDWNRFGKYVWSLRWESETAAECWAHVRRCVLCNAATGEQLCLESLEQGLLEFDLIPACQSWLQSYRVQHFFPSVSHKHFNLGQTHNPHFIFLPMYFFRYFLSSKEQLQKKICYLVTQETLHL